METVNLVEAALANTLAAVQRQVIDWNAVLKSNYLTAFDNWSQSVLAGRVDNSNPPQPPKGYVLGYFNDPTTGPGSGGAFGDTVIQWPYPTLGKDPVCALPPIPALPAAPVPGMGKIGTQSDGAPEWFNALAGDTTPIGRTIYGMSQDGITGLFKKFGAPVGPGYFEKVG